jgi:hypothetical protein
MKRRRALRTLIIGGFTAAMVHPKSRRRIVKTGQRGFEIYKSTMFKLSEKKDMNEQERSAFRARLNFSSKQEEEEFVKTFLKDFQETRIRNNAFFKRKITDAELMKHILHLTQKRREYATEYLRTVSFEGKTFTKQEIEGALIRYFRLNRKERRVPSEIEIRDMVDNGCEYR